MGHTILVIEDSTDICHMLDIAFSMEGYSVVTAENGQDGLEKLNICKPDLILLDVMMPVMDGKEVLATLHEQHNTTPVVVITASRSEYEQAWQAYRVEHALLKPFDLDDLYNVVDALVKPTSSGEFAAVLAR